MNKKLFLNFTLGLFLLTPISLPVAAEETNIQTITEKPTEKPSPTVTSVEAIIVTFPQDVEFDVGAKKKQSVLLRTVESVYNNLGQVIIPAKSAVDAALVPTEKSTMIVASSIIINGKSYPFSATTSNKIPAKKITKKSRIEQATTYSTFTTRLSPLSNNLIGTKPNQKMIRNHLLIQGAGAIFGFLSPRSVLTSHITKGSQFILHLEKPLKLNTTQKIPVVAPSGIKK